MTPERLKYIISKVQEKYVGQKLSQDMVHSLYKSLSIVISGLHKSEHFLNVSIDHDKKVILVKDEETMTYLGLLPYLDNRLMESSEIPYLVYLLIKGVAYSQCAIFIKDLYNGSTIESELGFGVEVFPMIPLGVYNYATNDFKRME